MTLLELGSISFLVLLVLIFLRAPIGLAMFLCGIGGLYLALGSSTVFMARLKTETYTTFSSYSLSIVPMFLLMGQFATLSGMSTALFKAAESWLGHKKGGVAMAAIGACAGFGAICGSSLATAATMSRVALPELRRYGYSGGFASATLAAGGTLGILIPPSIILVIYAILTEQNIAKLFLAAFVPGILAAIGYALAILIYMHFFSNNTIMGQRKPYKERFYALVPVWPVLLIFILVVGGIYQGWFTPTEAAAIGAAGTGIIAWLSGNLNWCLFKISIIETAQNTAMIFFIILGAGLYNGFLALTQLPQELANIIITYSYNPWLVLFFIIGFYLIFGCLMDSLSMILLTIPIFFPIINALNFGLSSEHTAIWFGILALIAVEIGLITPPVGLNLFILNAMDKTIPIVKTYKNVYLFIIFDLIRIIILILFPAITLFLL